MVSKKKRPNTPVVEVDSGASSAVNSEVPSPSSVLAGDTIDDSREEKKFVFKDPAFLHVSKSSSKKKGLKSLKQILTQERCLPWPESCIHYSSINAPPSFKPAKKYSDISGLPAKYTDPQSKLHYASSEEFSTVRSLPSDIIAGYLFLRRASSIIS